MQALIDFQRATRYLKHPETMLGYMALYHAKFEQSREVFIQVRITKVARPNAREIDKLLQWHQCNVSAGCQRLPTWKKRRQYAEAKPESNEQIQEALENKSPVNFIKMHCLNHYVTYIRKFGNILMWSTEVEKYVRKDFIKLRFGHS